MDGEVWCSTLLYLLLSLVIIFPPQEAISAGLTIEHFIRLIFPSESKSFVFYHIIRSTATIIAHCLILPGYVMTLHLAHPWLRRYLAHSYHPYCLDIIFALSFVPFIAALLVIKYWSVKGWRNHPFAKTIALYTTPEKSLAAVTLEINNEFIRIDKVSSALNSVSRVIATNSWLIKVTSYKMHLISLQDAILVLESSENAAFITDSNSPAQYLTVRVASVKEGIKPFSLRVNSTVWAELQTKLINPVVNTRQIVVHQTLADRFYIVFEETVSRNPKVTIEAEQDLCIGCMAVRANIKLDRRCRIMDEPSVCTPCQCRPMWCISCLSKWFAARQDQTHTDTWLSSRAPCPTCRSKFCLLDVCIIES